MELLYILTLFSLIGFVGVLVYLVLEKIKEGEKSEYCELLEEKVARLERYVYELEERMESAGAVTTDSKEEIKAKIIAMYEDGKDIFLIENTLDVPRPKIEMVLKFYKLKSISLE
jgi:hypothetical protein